MTKKESIFLLGKTDLSSLNMGGGLNSTSAWYACFVDTRGWPVPFWIEIGGVDWRGDREELGEGMGENEKREVICSWDIKQMNKFN